MSISNKSRIFIFIGIALLTFTIWFADGYMQWVNSDTAGEAFGTSQHIGFPQGLVSKHHQVHSRITGTILSYIPFHTVGYYYRELTNDPVNALYVSQGVMTGTIFMLLVLISAAYISTSAPILSVRYLVSAILLMLFTMSMPVLPLNTPISLGLRFGHQAVMTNYIGTMVIALFALFPYWRYLFSGNWDDWYNDVKWRTIFYFFIIATIFSSTATSIWLGTFAVVTFLSFIYYASVEQNRQTNIIKSLYRLLKNSKIYPLILIIPLCIIAVTADLISRLSQVTFSKTNLIEYGKIYMLFFINSGTILYVIAVCMLFILLIAWYYRKGTISSQLLILARIFPWLLIGNLIFIFVIGIPRRPYRFSGYNLGPDTVFPATWSMALWLLAVILCFWRENKLTWLAPVLLYVLITNSLTYFTFPGYESREHQKKILSTLHRENIILPLDTILPIPVEDVAFSKYELNLYTIPMLRNVGIISSQRGISVVSKEVYESWHTALVKNGTPPSLQDMKILKNYPDVFDPKVNKNLADSCVGVYGNEDTFHWLSPNALISLNANKKIATGIQIIFTTSDDLLTENRGVQLKVRILINDQHIKEIPIDGAKQYSVIIDKYQMPKPVDSIYNIKLLTNAYFNPSRMGISADNRDLSIKLFYIGTRS